MASFPQDGLKGSGALALVVGCLLTAIPAAPQTAAPVSPPMVLDHKIMAKLILIQVRPEYPTLARVNYIQGPVRMRLMVTREGQVGEAHVILGHPFLAVPALKAVRRWLFRPFISGSGPTEFLMIVDMHFTLHMKKVELLPHQPERDLDRQVRPPEILKKPLENTPTASVRLRVLVSDEGQALDSEPLAGLPSLFAPARKNLERWTFRPARWGALPVPWYLEVDVPVEEWSPTQGAADPGGQ